MPAIATGDNSCRVQSPDGQGNDCKYPLLTYTGECSTKVFVENFGVVRQGDRVHPHPKRNDCSTDESTLSTFSSKVFVEGKPVARIGDKYGNNVIVSGSSKVFCG